jgi:hypothetical protein
MGGFHCVNYLWQLVEPLLFRRNAQATTGKNCREDAADTDNETAGWIL